MNLKAACVIAFATLVLVVGRGAPASAQARMIVLSPTSVEQGQVDEQHRRRCAVGLRHANQKTTSGAPNT
jgi:hypothetical protein